MNNTAARSSIGLLYSRIVENGSPYLQQGKRSFSRLFLANQETIEDPSMALPSLVNMRDFVWYAAINNCPDNQLKKWSCRGCLHIPGATFISSFDSFFRGGHGYLAVDHLRKRIICSFRGIANTRNKVSALDVTRSPLIYTGDSSILVASGILNTMESLDFISPLAKLLHGNQHASYKVAFVGHSLGAQSLHWR
ncbi:hypothetical protein DSO57_1035857 [Entomophthora muscae]|uniref:Uncharacterized protein n=1 Tax=Entomophthora muscae TaxID=34485 RepID=A0ACC2RQB6_9FUNG|nr:hypothetical protein DSO57_1035857 [Entomophthora muscae]